MAILIDPPAWPAHGGLWSHLVSDSNYAELHAFAAQLGVPRRGFDLDHYDVPASLYDAAIAGGARPVTAKDVVAALRGAGLRVRQVERPIVTPLRRAQYLQSEWEALGARVPMHGDKTLGSLGSRAHTPDLWRPLGAALLSRRNEPHRASHDERHLEEVLLALNHLEVRGESISPATLTAAWFYDAIRTAHGLNDEAGSARLAHAALGELGVDPGFISQVTAAIIATEPALNAQDPPPGPIHLLDADLAIFAASPTRYAEYSNAVRSEHPHVADEAFAHGRLSVLAGYLERPFIYRGALARQLWESRAQANVAAEIATLTAATRRESAAKNLP